MWKDVLRENDDFLKKDVWKFINGKGGKLKVVYIRVKRRHMDEICLILIVLESSIILKESH